jgi:hypothetical protein
MFVHSSFRFSAAFVLTTCLMVSGCGGDDDPKKETPDDIVSVPAPGETRSELGIGQWGLKEQTGTQVNEVRGYSSAEMIVTTASVPDVINIHYRTMVTTTTDNRQRQTIDLTLRDAKGGGGDRGGYIIVESSDPSNTASVVVESTFDRESTERVERALARFGIDAAAAREQSRTPSLSGGGGGTLTPRNGALVGDTQQTINERIRLSYCKQKLIECDLAEINWVMEVLECAAKVQANPPTDPNAPNPCRRPGGIPDAKVCKAMTAVNAPECQPSK